MDVENWKKKQKKEEKMKNGKNLWFNRILLFECHGVADLYASEWLKWIWNPSFFLSLVSLSHDSLHELTQ